MPDLFDLIRRWWKYMLIAVILSVMVVGTILFIKPNQYLSIATAVPANAYTTDRASIFNENIQALYSSLGLTDDLDRVLGTAELDTVYLSVTDQFNLFDHYKSGAGPGAKGQAAAQLKRNTKVVKTGYGELKVKVWDTDQQLAPQLANAVMEKLNDLHQSVQNGNNVATLESIRAGRKKILAELDSLSRSIDYDSVNASILSGMTAEENLRTRSIRKDALRAQLMAYEKLINEYQLMADSKTPVLIVVEKARATATPDRPKRVQAVVATAVLAMVFSLLMALVLERRKPARA